MLVFPHCLVRKIGTPILLILKVCHSIEQQKSLVQWRWGLSGDILSITICDYKERLRLGDLLKRLKENLVRSGRVSPFRKLKMMDGTNTSRIFDWDNPDYELRDADVYA